MTLKASAQRIQDLLDRLGGGHRVVEMPDTTRTSEEAATACGCSVAEIGKSLLFRARETGRPVLVVASGPNRVDEKKIAAALGEKIGRADAEFVRSVTGFAIGGVPPIGHAVAPAVFLDEDLFAFARIWCAAGTPNAVFSLSPTELQDMTGGTVADVKRQPASS